MTIQKMKVNNLCKDNFYLMLKIVYYLISAFMRDYVKYSGDPLYTLQSMPKLVFMGNEYSREIFKIKEFQKVWNEEEFDLVLVEGIFGEPFYGFAAHFKCPLVVLNSFEPLGPLNKLVGNPTPFSYVSSIILGLKFPMSFIDRVKNYLAHFFLEITFDIIEKDMRNIYK